MKSSVAIRRLDLPAATSWSISCSRPLKRSGSPPNRRRRACRVPLQHHQELPEVARRDGRIEASSVGGPEHPGEDFDHRRSLVYNSTDVALRFGQYHGLRQGAYCPLPFAYFPQCQCLERNNFYEVARSSGSLGLLARFLQQPERFAMPSLGTQQPRRGQKVRRPGGARVSGGGVRARGPAFLDGGSLREIPARETKPRHPGHGDGDLQISVGAARDSLRFAGHLQSALLVALRQPRPGERDVTPDQVADLLRPFGQPCALL